MIRSLQEVLREHPDFRPGWNMETAEVNSQQVVTRLINPRFGSVDRVVVCRDDGSPIYDQYALDESPGQGDPVSGAVIVPYFNQEQETHVGLIENLREVPLDPATRRRGYVSLELPRGFSDLTEAEEVTAVRELGEETGKYALSPPIRLGVVNPNTTFYTTHTAVFAAEVDPTIVDESIIDRNEPIMRCIYQPMGEIKQRIAGGDIRCGFTLAGLMMFDAYKSRE